MANNSRSSSFTRFFDALQVATLRGQTEAPELVVEEFQRVVEALPAALSASQEVVLRSALITYVGRWLTCARSERLDVDWWDLFARMSADQDLRDGVLAMFEMIFGTRRRCALAAASPLDQRVAIALSYIRERRAAHPVRLEHVARAAGVSRWHLQKLLKAGTGCSFREHVRREWTAAACKLLIELEFSVKEVAFRVGYPRASDFSRDFRKAMGVSPQEWRRFGRSPACRSHRLG